MHVSSCTHSYTHLVRKETDDLEFVLFCLASLHTEDWLRRVLFGNAEQSNSLLVWSVKRHDQLKLMLLAFFDLVLTLTFESNQF